MKKKLFIAGMSFVIALILLATASFAWFTVSKSPEVTGMQMSLYAGDTLLLAPDNNGSPGDFSKYVSLSSNFAGLAPLRPVSTVDGVNWFLPAYDTETGELADVSEFILDDTLEHANVKVTDESGDSLTGDDYEGQVRKGYYVYTDLWMMTEESGANVRLSVPHEYGTAAQRRAGSEQAGLESSELSQAVYGTYVLGEPELGADGQSLATRTEQPETAIRVGFLVYQDKNTLDTGSYGETLPFTVYEPNATQRAGAIGSSMDYVVPDEDGDVHNTKQSYVSGYEPTASDAATGRYVITQPIALGADGKGTLGSIAPENLIAQTSSHWDVTETVTTLSGLRDDGITRPNSNDIATFGQFLETDERFALTAEDQSRTLIVEGNDATVGTSYAGSKVLVTLKKNTPIRVRIFVWIEGQDVDCWNDIASGTCRVNLELAGETIYQMEDPAYAGTMKGYGAGGTGNDDWFDKEKAGISRNQITELEFTQTAPQEYDQTWQAGGTDKNPINAYLVGSKVFIIAAPGTDTIYLPEDSSNLFQGLSSLTSIDGIEMLDTSRVKNMCNMFTNCNSLESLDVTGFDTSNVTQMTQMFYKCSKLTVLDLSSFDTSKVTAMNFMFYGCSSLTSLNISSFATSKVTNMGAMFYGCSRLTSLDVSSFDTSSVSTMSQMFRECTALTSLDLTGFDTSKVTSMQYMFLCCSSLTDLDISSFDTSKVTNMYQMFNGCAGFTTIYAGSGFTTSNVSSSSKMFTDCTSLVGGNGTPYSSSKVDKTYARIDQAGTPGYFTAKSN